MTAKKSFVLRLDDSTYKAIEKWANDEFRSVNGQLEWILHQALVKSKRIKPSAKIEKKESRDDSAPAQ